MMPAGRRPSLLRRVPTSRRSARPKQRAGKRPQPMNQPTRDGVQDQWSGNHRLPIVTALNRAAVSGQLGARPRCDLLRRRGRRRAGPARGGRSAWAPSSAPSFLAKRVPLGVALEMLLTQRLVTTVRRTVRPTDDPHRRADDIPARPRSGSPSGTPTNTPFSSPPDEGDHGRGPGNCPVAGLRLDVDPTPASRPGRGVAAFLEKRPGESTRR